MMSACWLFMWSLCSFQSGRRHTFSPVRSAADSIASRSFASSQKYPALQQPSAVTTPPVRVDSSIIVVGLYFSQP